MAGNLHLTVAPALERRHWGATLLSLSEDSSVPKRKYSLLPVLVLLFCVSYGILTMLVVEQGRTIDNQKSLIRQLFEDSSELTAMKMQKNLAAPKAQHIAPKSTPPAQTEPQGQIVVTPRDMQTQAPVNGDKSQAKPNQGIGKLRRRAPLHPPTGIVEAGDERRTVLSI